MLHNTTSLVLIHITLLKCGPGSLPSGILNIWRLITALTEGCINTCMMYVCMLHTWKYTVQSPVKIFTHVLLFVTLQPGVKMCFNLKMIYCFKILKLKWSENKNFKKKKNLKTKIRACATYHFFLSASVFFQWFSEYRSMQPPRGKLRSQRLFLLLICCHTNKDAS